jgi:hypothetical protein
MQVVCNFVTVLCLLGYVHHDAQLGPIWALGQLGWVDPQAACIFNLMM